MLKINELQRLHLGVKGENLAQTISIDMSAWAADYPNATAVILHQRYGDQTKDLTGATYDSETKILSWTPTSYDTFYEGYGVAEIRMVEGDVVKKTKDLIVTAVCASVIDGSGSVVPSDWQSFLNSVISNKQAAAAAQTAAETAQGLAEDAQEAAEEAAEEAEALINVSDVAGATATTLEPGSAATAEITTTETGKQFVFGIPKGGKGDTGATGQPGQDGYSPTASVSKSGSTATISITDKNGTTTATVSDGEDGAAGQDGADGQDAYVWIRYAAAQPTQDSDMKTTADAWMGVYTGNSSTAPTTYTSYTWGKIKGEDGAGAVAGIKMNGSSISPDQDHIVDLGTVITDVSGKLDTSKVYVGTDKTTTGYALDASIGKILNDKDAAVKKGLLKVAKLSSGNWILNSGEDAAIGDALSVNGTLGIATAAITGGSTVLVKNTNWAEVSGGILNKIIADKADKVTSPTSGDFAGLDANGNLTDSGKSASDFVAANQGSGNAGKALGVANDGTVTPVPFSGSDFTGATASTAGVHGYVPAPAAGQHVYFLQGDGTWAIPPGAKLVVFDLDTVTNVSGSYTHTTTVSGAAADMKAVMVELGNSDAFLDIIDITMADGSVTLSCDSVEGTSTVKISCMYVAGANTLTSSEFDTLAGRIGTLGNLTTTAKGSTVAAINELDSDIGSLSDQMGNLIKRTTKTVNLSAGSQTGSTNIGIRYDKVIGIVLLKNDDVYYTPIIYSLLADTTNAMLEVRTTTVGSGASAARSYSFMITYVD